MKKVLLLLSAIIAMTVSVRAAAEAENPHKPNVVVEGRTWTYIADRDCGPSPARKDKYDISIGRETEINGKVWHELIVSNILSWESAPYPDFDSPGSWHSDPDPKVISYIREEGSSVYVLFDFSALKTYDVLEEFVLKRTYIPNLRDTEDNELMEIEVLRLGDIGTPIPDWCNYSSIRIESISEMSYCNNKFKSYNLSADIDKSMSMVEQLGWLNALSEHFFAPTNFGVSTMQWNCALLYEVKDADGTVLFRKNEDVYDNFEQWYNGVGDVTVDEGDARLRWFTPQGIEVTEPQTTGVYIRMTGNRAEKVYIP